jgi:maltokinase
VSDPSSGHSSPTTPTEELTAFIQAARWFGGKGREFRVTGVRRLGWVETGTPTRVAVDLAEVTYDDAPDGAPDRQSVELYQVPLAFYTDPEERLNHAFVGWWEDPDLGFVHAYDALHDREAMAGWLLAFDQPPTEGPLHFRRLPGHDLDLDAHSTLFSGEQSNSSVAFGEDALLKVFRKVTPGINPDIAVHEVLTQAGSEHVPALYGWLETEGDDEAPLQLAMLQQFLRTATDGWDAAMASIRNLFAEGDLRADEVGGDFAAEAARLGESLAEVHHDLAEHFPTHVRTAAEQRELAAAMNERLDAALEVVPDLSAYEKGLRATFDAAAEVPGVLVQQVHGDLHLGQTLRTVKGWKIVDFEGEPAKPLAERVLPDSAWRDVAGMLRSFDYAPRVAERVIGSGADDTGAEQRAFRATEWAERNCAAFLDAYAGRELTDDESRLLDAYVADKAVYETVYEARNRPTWLPIPLGAIATLVG